jgi:hypothetical protein
VVAIGEKMDIKKVTLAFAICGLAIVAVGAVVYAYAETQINDSPSKLYARFYLSEEYKDLQNIIYLGIKIVFVGIAVVVIGILIPLVTYLIRLPRTAQSNAAAHFLLIRKNGYDFSA